MKIWLCALALAAHTAFAESEAVSVDVSRHEGNAYHFQLQFTAKGSSKHVLALLTDYNRLARLNPLIKSSRVLPTDSLDIDRVEIITRGCMLFFCKTIRRVEDVTIANEQHIKSTIVPTLSDFKSGHTVWTFTPKGTQTLVHFQATMVPDFWLPPFIGPYTLKKQVRTQLERTALRINQLLASPNQ